MATHSLIDAFSTLASEEATFVDKELLYIAAGALVLLALGLSFLGMRKKDFPSSSQLKAILPITALVVVVTGYAAIQTATHEQAVRDAENRAAAEEADNDEIQNEESFEDAGAGEAGDPESGTGSTPETDVGDEPISGTTGEQGDGNSVAFEGRTIFEEAGCSGCHTLADAGSEGQTGPDLDASVPEMSPEEVRTAIVDPDAEIAEGFNEGIMPSYEGELDELQIDTLVDYLITVTSG